MANKTFVGLLVLTKIPDNGQEKTVAILQRRGKYNADNGDGFKHQSYAGLCEITCYGQVKKGESIAEALERELTEEIGAQATKTLLKHDLKKIHERTEDDGDKVHIWSTLANSQIFKEIKLDISSAGIEIITKEDLPKINFVFFSGNKETVNDLNQISIFETPKEVIEKAFKLYCK